MDLANETYGQYFTQEMQADETFKPYGEMKGIDLINSHRELSAKASSWDTEKQGYEERLGNALSIPEDATPEQRESYYDIIRSFVSEAPEKAEDYQLELPEGVAADDPLLGAYMQEAFGSGMSSAQVNAGIRAFASYAAQAEAAAREASDTALKLKWGNDFETNAKKAFLTLEAAAKEVGLPVESVQGLSFLRNNPAFVQIMFNMARHYSEDSLAGAGGSAQDPQDAFIRAVSGGK